uniref:Cytochrome P450, family 46, subfamily A, polypeptide 1, tandem duplicate 2 n=1 Tax=Tetraodon nigroviridis TaxID=99883 RepID=H3CWE3_TETNG
SIFSWMSQFFIVLLFLLFIALLGYCLYVKYVHLKYDHIPGPPRDSFLFGHSSTLVEIMKRNGVVHDKFLEWTEIYGPAYRINLLHYVMVFVACPETTKEMLMSPKYTKDKFLRDKIANLFGQRFLGDGLVTIRDHDKWYKQRRIMDPAFSSLYLRGLMGNFNETAEKLMDKLSEIADNKTTANMLRLVNSVTMEIIEMFHANTQYTETVLKPKSTVLLSHTNIPEEIMTQEDEEFMLDNFVTFFIAGQETTANQLGFCIMELARHPEILKRARKEVDEVIGMKQDISYDDLGHLGYLSQVLKETLRIYPTAPGTSRDLVEDMVIGGVHVPKGVICIFSSYTMGRMEKFFKDPLKFDPDRFHPDAPKPYYCYFPFALGPRSCLGQNFAQMEAKVVMAKLIQRFDFTLPGQSFDILDNGTLRPKSGVVCSIRHRS